MSKATQLFSNNNYPIVLLVEEIDTGALGLPDLQRPFVWKRSNVRDFFDSLYNGYPAGYFLFWNTPKSVDSHSIGLNTTDQAQQKMIVDGQQRLTSLYAVIKGQKIINDDNEEELIRIAFRPLSNEFVVANAASDNDPEYVSNISEMWNSTQGSWNFTNSFIANLESTRAVSGTEQDTIGQSLARLENIRNYQFSALELSADLEVDVVAEIFQRINSRGISLNSADFILTLMSVHWPAGRHELEDFARAAKLPSKSQSASPYNHFHSPSPDQLLRVIVGLALHRGVLQSAYQVLLGRDPETRSVSDDAREARFNDLKEAQKKVLNLTDWHEYIVAVKHAGFKSGKMLTSANNFLYGYLTYLIGKHEFCVERQTLRDIISKWFFMTSLTGRYTGSPETALESDLRHFNESSDADGVNLLDGIIRTHLTDDYWKITLPDKLDSSSAWSPYLFGYYAALNLLEAKPLFSNMKLGELLDPGVHSTKSPIERHHLFPREYLRKLGILGTYKTNQIANFAFLEWADNVEISDDDPSSYFPEHFGKLTASEQKQARLWHALPAGWHDMEYFEFLRERRKLISNVVKLGFEKLCSGREEGDDAIHPPTVAELLREDETYRVEFKRTARVPLNSDIPEKVINEGVIKTVAAFMNSKGGTLGVGISDDLDVIGIQPDLEFKKQDIDGYQNWLSTLLMNSIGHASVANHVSIRFETVEGAVACLIDVKPDPGFVYADTIKGKDVFYVRVNNTTRILTGVEIVNYMKNREVEP